MVQITRPWISNQDKRRAPCIQGCFRLTTRSRADAPRARLNADVSRQMIADTIRALAIFGILGPPIGMLVFLLLNGGGYLFGEIQMLLPLFVASYEAGLFPAVVAALMFFGLCLACESLSLARQARLLLWGLFGAIAGATAMLGKWVLLYHGYWPPTSELKHVFVLGSLSGLCCGVLAAQFSARRLSANFSNAG